MLDGCVSKLSRIVARPSGDEAFDQYVHGSFRLCRVPENLQVPAGPA